MTKKPSYLRYLVLTLAFVGISKNIACSTPDNLFYQTKTPYSPQQNPASYEKPPEGFSIIYTQLVARHGSRGITGLKSDLAVYNMWKKAKEDNDLTPLGEKLGPDLLKIIKANFLLGYGVKGITKPGYGNETQKGIEEHSGLAVRMISRNTDLFKPMPAGKSRQISVVSSGKDRAVDSGAFFVRSLLATQPDLTPMVVYPTAPSSYRVNGTLAKPPKGTNPTLLYFHKLQPTKPTDPFYQTTLDSKAYQDWLSSPELSAKLKAITQDHAATAAGRAVMERLFTREFIDQINARTLSFTNSGTLTFESDDGKFTNTLTGGGKTKIATIAEAGAELYQLYSIAPGMINEARVDFTPYMPLEQAKYFAFYNDAIAFYTKGPGITEKGSITWKMAKILQDDFFNEVDAIARGDMTRMAKLRFTHAEIMIPFASQMGLKNVLQQQPMNSLYSYANNPWRGQYVSPMAANMQWDIYRHANKKLLVKMLYNEKETDFKAECDHAKIRPNSHFYEYEALKKCYQHVPKP